MAGLSKISSVIKSAWIESSVCTWAELGEKVEKPEFSNRKREITRSELEMIEC